MRLFLAAAALGAIVLASVAAAAPGSAKSRVVATGGRVTALAADGDRAAFVVRVTDPNSACAGVKLWEPLRAHVVRLQRPCPAGESDGEGTFGIALAGTRAAWLWTAGGNFVETNIMTATLARPKPTFAALGAVDHSGVGTFARSPP